MSDIPPIWLRREGDHIVVLVEFPPGTWNEVIRERADADAYVSHIWEGIDPKKLKAS